MAQQRGSQLFQGNCDVLGPCWGWGALRCDTFKGTLVATTSDAALLYIVAPLFGQTRSNRNTHRHNHKHIHLTHLQPTQWENLKRRTRNRKNQRAGVPQACLLDGSSPNHLQLQPKHPHHQTSAPTHPHLNAKSCHPNILPSPPKAATSLPKTATPICAPPTTTCQPN